MDFSFKTWLKLQEAGNFIDKTHDIRDNPGRRMQGLPPQGKRYAGWRDIRWGYGFHKGDQPIIPARIGSDVISGMGNVFRKRMGAGFPVYGSGYHAFFDPLTKSFMDGKDFIVVRTETYDKENDQEQEELHALTQTSLEKFRKMPDVAEAGDKAGVDISQEPSQITYEPGEKEGTIRIIYRFKLQEKTTSRLRLTQSTEDSA